MKHLVRLAVAAMLLVGAMATADVRDQLREAVELAQGIQSNTPSMMEKIPRTCRILRRAAKEARGTDDAERVGTALEHCRRAMEALSNGNPRHAQHRLERLITALGGTPSS